MQFRKSWTLGLAIAVALVAGGAGQALAQADISQTSVINEDDGFSGVCTAPCFSVEKTVEVFNPGNPAAPVGACGAGEYTYTYSLTHIGGSLPSPGINVSEFELTVDYTLVTGVGSIPTGGITPTLAVASPLNVVNWSFPDSTACPACLDEGKSSDLLFMCSPAGPGTSPDNLSVTAIILDAPGQCIVPVEQVVVGDPMPCTIGFWKNRSQGKQGTIQHYPDADFNQIVADALALSMGVFTTADGTGCPNFDDLICALESKGNRSTAERARQQLAATLLNLAAGAYDGIENGKCALYDGNWITSNGCGDALTVGDAVGTSKTGILSNDATAEHDALECLDDINNEIGVIQEQP